MKRRTLLGTAGCVLTGVGALGIGSGPVRGQDSPVSITFEDQVSDGRSVVVSEIETDVDIMFAIRNGSEELARTFFDAGETVEDTTITLSNPISETQSVTANAYPASGGSGLARVRAEITVEDPPARIEGLEPRLVEADPNAGFNYPYYLFAPDTFDDLTARPLLVEPTNTGTATDEFEQHRQAGERTVSRGFSRGIADELFAPLVVPVFPRPREQPVDGTHYVHQLDDTTMALDSGPLERVDLQLLAMVEDARERLADREYPVAEGIMLNGFSASGNFVDRFTLLHPDRVHSVTAGGLNGMAILPLEEADGHTLPYHVGIADVPELTGTEVDLAALDDVNQFLYMGGEDTNDTIPYTDAWTDDDLRETALAVYGDHMIEERFPRCQRAYEEAGVTAQFRVYEGAGHTPRPARSDLLAVHRRTIEGEDIDDLGETVRITLTFETTPAQPVSGEAVELDATGSDGGASTLTYYLWDFGNGDTAVGETVEYAFEEPGDHTVTLTTVSDRGTETTLTETVSVSGSDGTGDSAGQGDNSEGDTTGGTDDSDGGQTDDNEEEGTDGSNADDANNGETGANSDGGGAGLGIGTGIAGLGGVGYLLKRRLPDED